MEQLEDEFGADELSSEIETACRIILWTALIAAFFAAGYASAPLF